MSADRLENITRNNRMLGGWNSDFISLSVTKRGAMRDAARSTTRSTVRSTLRGTAIMDIGLGRRYCQVRLKMCLT
jgi:hypothetical protein